jgi:hypothetical protein
MRFTVLEVINCASKFNVTLTMKIMAKDLQQSHKKYLHCSNADDSAQCFLTQQCKLELYSFCVINNQLMEPYLCLNVCGYFEK